MTVCAQLLTSFDDGFTVSITVAGRPELVDQTIQAAIFSALEWSQQEIGEFLGVGQDAISHRIARHRTRFDKYVEIVNLAKAKYLNKTVEAIEKKADVKARIHKKAYAVVEKTLDAGLRETKTVITNDGNVIEVQNDPTSVHLKAADMGIERVEGKALDRKEINEKRENILTVTVDESKLESILATAERLNQLRSAAYQLVAAPVNVQEAEIVESSN